MFMLTLSPSDFSLAVLLGEGNAAPPSSMLTMLTPLLLIGLLFYFMLIRPEKRKQSEVARMQQNLKKNDRVVTIGGIIGVVVNAAQGSDEVTLRVDESSNTRIRVVRSAVSRVLSSEKAEKAQEDDSGSKAGS
jgi:preprotein translocase subunit YajC